MSAEILEDFKDLLEEPIYATIATLLPNGQPHVNVVWCDYDGEYVLINTARGRQKEKNMSARPMATVLLRDRENEYRWLEIRGTVEEVTEEGAVEHIDKLAKQYTGHDKYFGGAYPAEWANQQIRVICKIKPTKVVAFNPKGG